MSPGTVEPFTTSDGSLLLAAILAATLEDTPRLAYADWLQEQGQPERAEFIRVQCELTRRWPKWIGVPPDDSLARGGDYDVLRRRERELLYSLQEGSSNGSKVVGVRAAARYVWAGPVAVLDDPDHRGWEFRRGFVESLTCSTDSWLTHGDVICAQHPVQRVTLTTVPEMPNGVWDHISPHISRATRFEIAGQMIEGPRQLAWVNRRTIPTPGRTPGPTRGWYAEMFSRRWPGVTFELPPV